MFLLTMSFEFKKALRVLLGFVCLEIATWESLKCNAL